VPTTTAYSVVIAPRESQIQARPRSGLVDMPRPKQVAYPVSASQASAGLVVTSVR
jgi:hypothetical protein